MAPLPDVPGVLRITLQGTSALRNWANVFHAQYAGATPTVDDLLNMGESLGAYLVANLTPLQDTETSISQLVLTDLSSNTGAQAVVAQPQAGTRTGGLLPASAAALVNYNSSFRYRGGHPRTYWFVGVVTDLLNQSTWTTDFTTDIQNLASGWNGELDGLTFGGVTITNQCAVSYRTAKAPRVVPIIMPILTVTADNGVASQRRRMRRR